MIFLPLAGIIAEFNPLHSGHKYLIDCAKNDGNAVACVISGNFVQRGDVAIVPKFSRAQMALCVGADIVLELPVPWSMSTAQNFALGAVSQLATINIDTLYFGSESGDLSTLLRVSDTLHSYEFKSRLSARLSSGKTFARLRREIVCELLGADASVLDNPNDTLAIEYIGAAKQLGLQIAFKAIKRVGAQHNDDDASGNFTTATLLRDAILQGDTEYIKEFMPDCAVQILHSSPVANIARLDSAIISRIKQLDINELSMLPDISEGIDRLIYSKAKEVFGYAALCDAVKTKRYTMARIRRLILSAYLGIDNSFFLKEPPYARVLGFTESGSQLFPKNSGKPIITKVSQMKNLDAFCQKVFETENKINEQYALSLDAPAMFINELSQRILIE